MVANGQKTLGENKMSTNMEILQPLTDRTGDRYVKSYSHLSHKYKIDKNIVNERKMKKIIHVTSV